MNKQSPSKVQETPPHKLPTIKPPHSVDKETYTLQLRLPHLNFNRVTVSVEDDSVVLDANSAPESSAEPRSHQQKVRLPEDVDPEPFFPCFELGLLNLTFNRKSWTGLASAL